MSFIAIDNSRAATRAAMAGVIRSADAFVWTVKAKSRLKGQPLVLKAGEMALDPSKPVWKNIEEGKWGERVPLIEKKSFEVTVYVDRDGVVDGLLEELENTERSLKNRERLKALQNKLQQYSIGVNKNYLGEWHDKIGNFVGERQEKLEKRDDFCFIIRPCAIGEETDQIYHPVAGFAPLPDSSPDEGEW